MSPRPVGVTPVVRDLVLARDRFCCVFCTSTDHLQVHHRRPRGMGGSRRSNANQPGNLVTLCAGCHRLVESNRREALDRGLLLPQSVEDPSSAPLVWHGRTVVLHDDGRVEDVEPSWPPA